MENTNEWRGAQDASDQQNEWQRADTDENETTEFRTDAEDYEADAGSIFASNADRNGEDEDDDGDDNESDDDDDDADDDIDDDEKEAESLSDWGDIDPQSSRFPTGNEPSAPGSAV